MSKIQVRLNPDVIPSGSDLAIVNAARRSFNTRSEWDKVILSHQELEENSAVYNKWETVEQFYEPYFGYELRKIKDKDKRLIQFLARGMTADDFEEFLSVVRHNGHFYGEHTGEDKVLIQEVLIKKLWEWRNTPTHDTPFNHCFISFEVKAPIFVARQLVKHEYLIMSEFSRRYITDDIEFYEPDYWRKAAPNKKQGSLEERVDLWGHKMWDAGFLGLYMLGEEMQEGYQERNLELFSKLLEAGVAPEQARMVLPQSTMTEWTWSGTLGAFAKMCQLRLHPEAQYEARLVAKEIYKHLLEYYPVSAKALVEGADV